MVFSSKQLHCPAWSTATSFAIDCEAAWIRDSAITGLTLPGMIELPGCTSGSASSPRPQRGPEPKRRTSLAILRRLTATVRIDPEA